METRPALSLELLRQTCGVRAHAFERARGTVTDSGWARRMGYYQKLWGDVSLHEALNGQVGRDFAHQMRSRGRNEHRDWAAGYVNTYTLAPSRSPLADKVGFHWGAQMHTSCGTMYWVASPLERRLPVLLGPGPRTRSQIEPIISRKRNASSIPNNGPRAKINSL